MNDEIVPFGKYKGQSIINLLNDKKYLEWCKNQEWFKKFTVVYNICVNQTIITNPASSIDTAINLQFIPFPYFILFIIASIIILMLHFKAKLAAIPTLYGIVGPFLSFSILTTLIIINIKN